MNILIAGGSGFLGQALVQALKDKHQLTVLGRDRSQLQSIFSSSVQLLTWDSLNTAKASTFDAVINLCGENIGASRWTAAVKKALLDSRVKTNTLLIDWLIANKAKPHYLAANGVGIYGPQQPGLQTNLDEDSPINWAHPADFMTELALKWEASTQKASAAQIPLTLMRFGVVLKKGAGMLKKLEPSFKLGLGAVLGDGQQTLSWIDIDDFLQAVTFLLDHPHCLGPVNLSAPNPVSQKVFAQTLAHTLHRPLLLRLPAFLVRFLFGEMGESLLLSGQRVTPKRLETLGFVFKYPHLDQALLHAYQGKTA